MKMRLARVLVAALALAAAVSPSLAQFIDQRVYAGNSGGTSSAYTITIGNYGGTAIPGIPIRWVPHTPNPSTATVTIAGGSGPINLCKPSPSGPVALTGGELQANQPVEMIYNATAACQVVTSSVDSASSSIAVSPQGYLTPCPATSPPTGCTAGQVAPTGDVTVGVAQSVTGIVYTPMAGGNQIPIWNGSRFVVFQFPEMTLTLTSSMVANSIRDVCVFSNAGTPTLVASVAWTTATAGAGNRGTGAGTAEIVKKNGVWVNAVSISGAINGANTYNVPASQCTMVGSMLMSGSNGVLVFNRSYGQSRRWPISNIYNKLPILLQAGDTSAGPWTYNTSAWRASNNNAANSLTVFQSVPEDQVEVTYSGSISVIPGGSTTLGQNSIGINGSLTPSGTVAMFQNAFAATFIGSVTSKLIAVPFIGINTYGSLEFGNGVGPANFYGSGFSVLTARWRG